MISSSVPSWKMLNRTSLSRTGNLWHENLGQEAVKLISNLCFTIFVVGVLVFTIIAATYEPEDPLFRPSSSKLTTFLTSTSNATFKSDNTVVRTGEDFMPANQTAFENFINVTDVDTVEETTTKPVTSDCVGQIDCTDPEVFHLMMKSAIERFSDIHFYRFGKAVPGDNDTSCHMAWRFRPKEGRAAAFYKDYRSFLISRSENCTLSVDSIGEYHSGGNARKRKRKNEKAGFFEKTNVDKEPSVTLPVVGETVIDTLPVVESESSFSRRKYLAYVGGGDRCKSMDHYLWSFMCALGEAQYLNRTLVMDMSVCLSSKYTSSGQNEEGKEFRFYFDFEHLKDSASVLDHFQFWSDWKKWHRKDSLRLHLVENYRVTPMKLIDVDDTLIMRKFGMAEPDNYWYRVCEGETESIVQRPWHLVWKSRRLMDIVSGITARLDWDFDSVHIVRGEKAANKEIWPNLETDTSPESILSVLTERIDDGRNLYVATDESDSSYFDPLKDRYTTHFLEEFKDLWDENSEWYSETMNLTNGVPVEFDGYMKNLVDTEVFLRGKKQIETFNDLTRDCKDGINTCNLF